MTFHRMRCGFSLTDLLVVLAILAVLAGLLLPAAQASREAADTTGCNNNLRALGLGVLNYNDQHGDMLPMGAFSGGTSWAALILPYMEETRLWRQLRLDQPYNAAPNSDTTGLRDNRAAAFPYLICPSRRTGPQFTDGYPASDYAAPSVGVNPALDDPSLHDTWMECHSLEKNYGLMLLLYDKLPEGWPNDESDITVRRSRSKTSFSTAKDGLGHQIFFGEKALHKEGLNKAEKGGDFTCYAFIENSFNASGPARPHNGGISPSAEANQETAYLRWGSWHPDVCLFSMGDGRVRPVNNAASDKVVASLCDRRDGAKLALPEDGKTPFDDAVIVAAGAPAEPATTAKPVPGAEPATSTPAPDTRGFEEKFAAERRTWTDKTGTYKVEAIYAGFEPGVVLIQKADMSTARVKLADLSEADRRYAVAEARKRGDFK